MELTGCTCVVRMEASPGCVAKVLDICVLGVEVAASLSRVARSVTIVDLVEEPFQLALGREVGSAVRQVNSKTDNSLDICHSVRGRHVS